LKTLFRGVPRRWGSKTEKKCISEKASEI